MRNGFVVAAALLFTVAGLLPAVGEDTPNAPTGGAGGGAAPVGVVGADLPKPGAWSVALAASLVRTSGSLVGTRWISPQETVSVTPWFFNPAFPTRLVPLNVHTSTQRMSFTYGLTEHIALSGSVGMVERTLEATTFFGARGLQELPRSYTGTAGLADTGAGALVKLYQDDTHRLNASFILAIPTGGIENTFTLIGTDGRYVTTRAFYGMQPGGGTVDALPGVTYAGKALPWSWGLAWRARLPFALNSNGWQYGDLHDFSGWIGYDPMPGVTTTLRVAGSRQGPIRGFDWEMRGRAQSANPNFYGGERVDIFLGASCSGALFGFDAWALGVEGGMPVYQNLNGPQLARHFQATAVLKRKL